MKKILEIKNVSVCFNLRGKTLKAIRNVSLDLYDQEILAIVGESGSGKSVLSKTLIGMTDKNGWLDEGSIVFEDHDLSTFKKESDWLKIRGKKIAMVFQDPMTALNPLKKIGEQIREAIALHQALNKEEQIERTMQLMEKVGILDVKKRYHQYPHEFSGGMRQRIVIATALACNPKILICDEPTTALDVTLQAQILKLIKDLQKEFGFSVIFITHDLGVVAHIADRVCVMYAGEVIEMGRLEDIFYEPAHPYTKALLKALPQLGTKGEPLYSIAGTPPNLFKEIKGDAFAPRNPDAMRIDHELAPEFYAISETHSAKTWSLDPIAIKKHGHPVKRRAQMVLDHPLNQTNKVFQKTLLEVKNVSVTYGKGKKAFVAVDDVSFEIYQGETFSLVGESGSGKTTIGRAIMKTIPTSGGTIRFKESIINRKMSLEEIRTFRQNVQMIFQDPMASLNERAKVDYIIKEGLLNFKLYDNKADLDEKIESMMKEVGLIPDFASRFPHEFSGGQRQRIGIARSLVMRPELVICDEPISALDVSIRAQVINLLNNLKSKYQLTYLFIAHDLSVVRFISDRVAVIHKGKIVELADSEKLFKNPLHPYTKSLLKAIPMPDPILEKQKTMYPYDESIHDYSIDKPIWFEIEDKHFIYGNQHEIQMYQALLKENPS